MPSGRKSSKVSNQEQTDRAIAVVVVILFLGITIFLMTGNEQSEIIEKLSTSAIQEDIADDDLYGDEPDELSDEMEIEGKTYKMERESSRTIDRSYHNRAADETPAEPEMTEKSDEDLGQTDESRSHQDSPQESHEEEKQPATIIQEVAGKAAVPVTTIASVIEEKVEEVVEEKPIQPKQEPEQQATDTQTADCVIIIGGYKNSSNVSKLRNRLERANYDHFTVPYRDLTRVGIRVPCDPESYNPVLRTIRSKYAEDAVLLQPK